MRNWIINVYEVYWSIYCWEIYEFILFDLGYIFRACGFEILINELIRNTDIFVIFFSGNQLQMWTCVKIFLEF